MYDRKRNCLVTVTSNGTTKRLRQRTTGNNLLQEILDDVRCQDLSCAVSLATFATPYVHRQKLAVSWPHLLKDSDDIAAPCCRPLIYISSLVGSVLPCSV